MAATRITCLACGMGSIDTAAKIGERKCPTCGNDFDRRAEPTYSEGPCVEQDDEGRPYQCGAFVCGDRRWECVRESDHEGDHDWRILCEPTVAEPGDVEDIVDLCARVADLYREGKDYRGALAALRTQQPTGDVEALVEKAIERAYRHGYARGASDADGKGEFAPERAAELYMAVLPLASRDALTALRTRTVGEWK